MPGLLDFLGLDQQPQQGGLLNQEQQGPDWRAILQRAGDFGQGLLQASGPSMSPVAPSLGQMLGAGAQAMQQGDQNRQVGAMRDMQAKAMGQQFQQNQMAMDATKRKQDANTRLAQAFAPTQVADASGQIGYAPPKPVDIASFVRNNFADLVDAGHDPTQLMAAMQKGPKTTVLKPGDVAYDENTGQERFRAPEKQDPTELEKTMLAAGVVKGSPEWNKTLLDYAQRKGEGSQTNVNVTNSTGKSLSGEIGPMMRESRDSALGAIDSIDAVGRIRGSLDNANFGPGATVRTAVDRLAQVFGVGGADANERLANTRQAIKGLAELTLAARRALKGQGSVTENEGKLVERAASGSIDDLSIPEIRVILDVQERLARKQYKMHEVQLNNLKTNSYWAEAAPFYAVPPLPAPIASLGGSPGVTPDAARAELERRKKGR